MSTAEFLKTMNYDQLQHCRDQCEKMIEAIQNEEKKVAWAVTDGSMVHHWFRTEDYLKAVERLADEAKKRWKEEENKDNPEPRLWLNISIRGQRFPLSEYDALFADGQWG